MPLCNSVVFFFKNFLYLKDDFATGPESRATHSEWERMRVWLLDRSILKYYEYFLGVDSNFALRVSANLKLQGFNYSNIIPLTVFFHHGAIYSGSKNLDFSASATSESTHLSV